MCSDFDMKALATAGLAFRRTRFALRHENTTLAVGCTSTCESENCVTFAFDDGPPLRLSLDVARRAVARSVTLTDVPPAMLALAKSNAQQNGADLNVARFDWSEHATSCNFACGVLLGADVCYSPLHADLLARVVRDTEAPIAVFASLATRSDFGTLVKLLEAKFAVTEHAITLLSHDADDERDAAGLGVAPTAPLEVAFRVVVVRART